MKHIQPLAVTLPEMGQKIRGGEGSEGSIGLDSSQASGEGPWHMLVRGHCSQKDLGIIGKEEFIVILFIGLQEKFKLEGVGPACVLGVVLEENSKSLPFPLSSVARFSK